MRRYIALFIVLAVAVSLSAVASASPFPDVPAYHWAYDAVKAMANLGIYEGYPDGEFKGDDPLSRYESALVVARLLSVVDAKIRDEIAAVGVQVGDEALREAVTKIIVEDAGRLTEEEVEARFARFVEALEALRAEFAAELDALGLKLETVDSLIAASRAEIADIKVAVSANSDALKALDKRVSELEARALEVLDVRSPEPGEAGEAASGVSTGVAALKEEIKAGDTRLEGLVSSLEGRTDRVESAVADLKSEVDSVKALVESETDARISELESSVGELNSAVAALSELNSAVAALSEENATLDKRIGLLSMRADAVEDAILEVKNELQALFDRADASESRIAGLESLVAELNTTTASLAEEDAALDRRIGLLRMRADAAEDAILELRNTLDEYSANNTAEIEALKQRLAEIEGKHDKLNRAVGLAAVLGIVVYGMTR